jgi:3',5'-cyclic-AMP phosphodiesterase
VVIAQISDTHIKRRGRVLPHMPHVVGPLRRVPASIAEQPSVPSYILATGDLTESGHPEEYRRLREILDARVVTYLMPGNHDRRDAMREVFADSSYLHGPGEPIQYVIESPLMRVIAMDSSDGTRQSGYLDAARLQWLEERLPERPHVPTIIAMHHPPVQTGVRYFDEQPFEGREELARIVRAHPQIRRILCGHIHQMICRTWNGTIAVSSPSTAPTTELVRVPSEPVAVVA